MDLLRLGAQSRKTGIRPRDGLVKDKFDMEDIDEFFDETSWSDSRPSSAGGKRNNSKLQQQKGAPKKTLGVGRIKSSKIADASLFESTSKVSEAPLRNTPIITKGDIKDKGVDLGQHADALEIGESSQEENFAYPDLDNEDNFNDQLNQEISDTEGHNNTLSPIPLSSLDSRRGSEGASLPSPTQNSPVSSSRFTKAMASKKAKGRRGRPKIVASDLEDNAPEESSENKTNAYDDIHSQDSSGDEFVSQPTQTYDSYRPTQPSPLPSPPPEGLRRSKRRKIAPLAYWRNERIVYSRTNETNGDPDSTLIKDIRKIPLQEISAVVHVPAAADKRDPVKRKKAGKTQSVKSNALKPPVVDYDSDPEIEGSEWFKQKYLETEVFDDEETKASRIVAWAPDGGNYQSPPPTKNGQQVTENFRVAPLFDADSDIIAAGMLEFPNEGFKSLRTTGESLFMFHVTKGLLEVTLNSEKFVVTRGCSFEVPKFNIYSFKNIGKGPARLFFVQCKL